MKEQIVFILVDDDAICNMLSEIFIEEEFPKATIMSFIKAQEAIDYILDIDFNKIKTKYFLFLDIHMPLLTGWDLLTILEEKGFKDIRNMYIYMLSSSVNHKDILKSENSTNIISFVEKPLSNDFLIELSQKFSLK